MIVLGTQAMLRNMPPVSINFCGEVIPDSGLVKNLGVYIDSYLSYRGYLDVITKTCTGILSSLNYSSQPFMILNH